MKVKVKVNGEYLNINVLQEVSTPRESVLIASTDRSIYTFIRTEYPVPEGIRYEYKCNEFWMENEEGNLIKEILPWERVISSFFSSDSDFFWNHD